MTGVSTSGRREGTQTQCRLRHDLVHTSPPPPGQSDRFFDEEKAEKEEEDEEEEEKAEEEEEGKRGGGVRMWGFGIERRFRSGSSQPPAAFLECMV